MKRIGLLVGIVVLLAGLVAGYRYYLVHELRGQVLAQLNDPESAQFRNETYVGPWTVNNSMLCGQVNAKNRMGGYVGFKSFSATTRGTIVVDSGTDGECDGLVSSPQKPVWWWLRW